MANKKTMVVVRQAPHGTIYVQEALDVIFVFGAYTLDLSMIFTGDGVLALKQGQDTTSLGNKGFAASLGTLSDWDIYDVYVDAQAMRDRNMTVDDLLSIGTHDDTGEILKPKLLEPAEIAELLHQQDAVLSF